MEILKSRLFEFEQNKRWFKNESCLILWREEEAKASRSVLPENTFGNQIRNYVLQPYQVDNCSIYLNKLKLVKDNRTGIESNNPENVLNGEELDRWEILRYDIEKTRFLKESLIKLDLSQLSMERNQMLRSQFLNPQD